MREAIEQLSYFDFFALTVVGFLILYFAFATSAYIIFTKSNRFKSFQEKSFRPGQIRTEISRSMVSIFMFAILSIWMRWALKVSIYRFDFDFDLKIFGLELLALFFWNEIYFYIFHRLFHLKAFYKLHAYHHYSTVPSPFSAYSFHWTEGIVLGAVMPVALFLHDFQVYSILLLPVMSIFMNVLGHSNVDFFPEKGINSILSFSKRHSQHHKNPHKNFGFFLPTLDKLMGTIDES